MLGKAKKIRKRLLKIPLSSRDKFIYGALVVFFIALFFIMMLVFGYAVPMAIAFSDDKAVAAYNDPAIIAAVVSGTLLCVPPAIAVGIAENTKQPIFGNKDFKRRMGQPYIEAHPIVSKDFFKKLPDRTRRRIRVFAVIMLVLCVFSVCLTAFTVNMRTALDRDNNIVTYGSFGKATQTVNMLDAEKLVIDIDMNTSKGGTTYHLDINFVFADTEYGFSLYSFKKMNTEEALEYMIYIKSLFPERYEITNASRLERFLRRENFDAQEEKLVRELLDLNKDR